MVELDTARPGVDLVDYDRALPVFDVASYVEDFNESVMPAYRSGTADRDYAADNGLARSIIPPGTAATRDFSTLAPRIPQLLADARSGARRAGNDHTRRTRRHGARTEASR